MSVLTLQDLNILGEQQVQEYKLTPTISTTKFINLAKQVCMSIKLVYPSKFEAVEGVLDLRDYLVDENVLYTLYDSLPYPKEEIEEYSMIVSYPIASTKQLICNVYLDIVEDMSQLPLMSNILVDKTSVLKHMFFAPTGQGQPTVIKYINPKHIITNPQTGVRKEETMRYEFVFEKDSSRAYYKVTLSSFINSNRTTNPAECLPLFTASVMLDRPERNLVQATLSNAVTALLMACREQEG